MISLILIYDNNFHFQNMNVKYEIGVTRYFLYSRPN